MLRDLGARASRPQIGETNIEQRMGVISVAFVNHENTKRLEFHEIFESRISRILWDSTEKFFLRRVPLRQGVFLFPFAFS